jgi:hypothetical protein
MMERLPKFVTILVAALAGLGLLLAAAILVANRRFSSEARSLSGRARQVSPGVVTAEMLQGLPAPVQRYLTYTGVVGKPMVSTVRLEMTGRIRQAEEQSWMGLEANEFYTVSPPAFTWHATTKMAGLPLVRVRDSYLDGEGGLQVSLLGLVTMDDARGADVDQGSLMRYLNEVMWFPSAFLGDNITWEAIDDDSARVTLTDRGESVSAVLTFDEEGRLANFVGERYYHAGTPESVLIPWSTPITSYGEFEGLRLPAGGHGVWHLDSGEFTYIELEITDIQFDVAAP